MKAIPWRTRSARSANASPPARRSTRARSGSRFSPARGAAAASGGFVFVIGVPRRRTIPPRSPRDAVLASRPVSTRGLAKWSGLLAGALLVLYAWQAAPGITRMAPTFDEPAHIGAGLSYLKTGDFKINLQHPPLLKDIAA